MRKYTIKALTAGAIALAMTLSSGANAEIYKGETAGVGGPVHTMFVAFANQARKGGVDIQVNAGQTLTKSMLWAAKGDVGFYSGVPSLAKLMAAGKKMYKPVADAPELSRNLRSIFGYKAGAYHPVTLAGSGIVNWSDIKGKTVFTGPPSSGAAATSEELIRIITGYEPDKDYTAVRLSWGEGVAALADGKVDMMFRPAEIGSANIEQFGLNGEFRILSIPTDAAVNQRLASLLARPGRGKLTFDGSVYKGQLTGGKIISLGFFQFVGTNKDMPDDVIYAATKAFWENIDEVHATAFFLKGVTKDAAFISANVPLHPGALRYYREAGFDVPADLIPSE